MKLNAPEGYRWEDADVRFEKCDSWHDGFTWGAITVGLLAIILILVIL